jgi:hypothetical protein
MNSTSSVVTGLLLAAFGGLIVLMVERIVISQAESHRENLVAQYTRAFLQNWYEEVESVLEKITAEAESAEPNWSAYLDRLQADPNSEEPTPGITYTRVVLPDISEIVTRALPYLTEPAYENLLYLNNRLRILDERERQLSELFDSTLTVKHDHAFRLRLANFVRSALQDIKQLVTRAREYYSKPGLADWMSRTLPNGYVIDS